MHETNVFHDPYYVSLYKDEGVNYKWTETKNQRRRFSLRVTGWSSDSKTKTSRKVTSSAPFDDQSNTGKNPFPVADWPSYPRFNVSCFSPCTKKLSSSLLLESSPGTRTVSQIVPKFTFVDFQITSGEGVELDCECGWGRFETSIQNYNYQIFILYRGWRR